MGRTPDAKLNHYAETASALLRKNVQPDHEMTYLDMVNLPMLARTENARHPGLNLQTFTDVESFVEAAANPTAGHFRAIVPMQFQGPGLLSGVHHVMADVRTEPGQPPSIVFLESGFLGGGNFDCVMFALNFALKSHEHQAVLDDMHNNLRETGRLTQDVDFERVIRGGRGLIGSLYGPEVAKEYLRGINFAVGADVLPPAFYKHTHSKTEAGRVDKVVAEQAGAADTPDAAGKPPGPLAQRVEDFRVKRQSPETVAKLQRLDRGFPHAGDRARQGSRAQRFGPQTGPGHRATPVHGARTGGHRRR
jgi:hypothetical protein